MRRRRRPRRPRREPARVNVRHQGSVDESARAGTHPIWGGSAGASGVEPWADTGRAPAVRRSRRWSARKGAFHGIRRGHVATRCIGEGQEVTVPPILEPAKSSPVQIMVRGALVFLLLFLIFGVIIPIRGLFRRQGLELTSLEPAAIVLGCRAGGITVRGASGRVPVLTTGPQGVWWAFVAQDLLSSWVRHGPGAVRDRGALCHLSAEFRCDAEDFGRSYVGSTPCGATPTDRRHCPCCGAAPEHPAGQCPATFIILALIGLPSRWSRWPCHNLMRSEHYSTGSASGSAGLLDWGRGLVRSPAGGGSASQAVVLLPVRGAGGLGARPLGRRSTGPVLLRSSRPSSRC